MINKTIFIFLFTVFWSFLNGCEQKTSLYYIKLGAAHPFEGTHEILPSFGLGARFQKNYYGFDLSASLDSLVLINRVSLKSLLLFFPFPEKKHRPYFGVGPGTTYQVLEIPMGQPFGVKSRQQGWITLEGVCGYEFRNHDHFKTFVQLELSQPLFQFQGYRCYKPTAAIQTGIGF